VEESRAAVRTAGSGFLKRGARGFVAPSATEATAGLLAILGPGMITRTPVMTQAHRDLRLSWRGLWLYSL